MEEAKMQRVLREVMCGIDRPLDQICLKAPWERPLSAGCLVHPSPNPSL